MRSMESVITYFEKVWGESGLTASGGRRFGKYDLVTFGDLLLDREKRKIAFAKNAEK